MTPGNLATPVYPNVLTPASFAFLASEGRYTLPAHLDLLNRKLVEVVGGRLNRLIVSMPPRHGKSQTISHYFPAYYLGLFPDRSVILTSYEADFASEWGGRAQEVLARTGPGLFGVEVDPRTTAASRWDVRQKGTTRALGGMRTAGVGGPLTGRGAHLLLIDDPVKNAEDAQSETQRRKAWEWYTTTASTRLEPGGAVILVMTRWHEDDLAGRLIEWAALGHEHWDVVRIPALAEPGDILGRPPGAALWPERGPGFTRRDLEARRAQDPYAFEALYQGNPIPASGGMFQRAWFERNIVDAYPPGCTFCRGWDFAASEGKGDWTVGPLLGKAPSGLYYVINVRRGQWSVGGVDQNIMETAADDRQRYGHVTIVGEEQPGAAGKKAADAFVLMLAGYDVKVVRASPQQSKAVRARPFASQCEHDHVKFVRGPWLDEYIAEFCRFPRGKWDDQVDGTSLSFNELALGETSEGQTTVAEPRDSWSRVLA